MRNLKLTAIAHRLFPLVALCALPAAAQFGTGVACQVDASAPNVRSEGVADPAGQLVLSCTGGSPRSEGSLIANIDISVVLNTNITSRKLGSGNLTEVLLMLDEPTPGPPNTVGSQLVASASPNTTNVFGTGTGDYLGGLTGRPNVFVGVLTGNNRVTFGGVPFDAPGSGKTRTIRIVNLRADATQLTGSQAQVLAAVIFSTSSPVAILPSISTIGFVSKSLSATVPTLNLSQCQPGAQSFKITFTELFSSAFRILGGTNQNQPGEYFDTESMFTNSAFAGTIAAGAGVATQATRLTARFTNIPANVSIRVPTSGSSANGFETASLLAAPNGGSTANVDGTLNIVNGAATAVWEMTAASSEFTSSIDFVLVVTTQSSPAPATGAATVQADYTPYSTPSTADSDIVPRFLSTSQATGAIVVAACQTPLTFVTAASLPGAQAGVGYSLLFQASGGIPPYSFTAQSSTLPPGLTLNSQTGALSGVPTAPGTYTFNVAVSDHASLPASVSRAFTLVVTAAASIPPGILPTGNVGVAYTAQLGATGFQSAPTWQIVTGALPPGLSLNTATGAIQGTPTTAGVSNFQVRAFTSTQSTESVSFSITINAAAVINSALLPAGSIGVAYTAQLTTSGFLTTPTWQIQAGSLPPGLLLNTSTGMIQGTPTTNGSYPFQIRAFTDTQSANPVAFTITIGTLQIDFTPERLPDATFGVSYAQQLSPTGGEGNYLFTVTRGTPPPGISLSSSGAVTGTPTQPGTFNFSVRLTSGSLLIEKQVTLVVASADIKLTPSTLPDAYVAQAYSQPLAATGGLAPYQFQVATGSLPPGLALTSAGLLSGTPSAAGSFTFSVQVADATSKQSAQTFTLAVRQAVTLPFNSLSDATQGEPYSASFQAAGGLAPFTYRVQDGALPTGLSLSAAGQLTGTPTTAGEFRFTVQATDANQRSASNTYVLTVIPALVISTTSLPSASALVSYTATLVAAGGVPPYTWQVVSGAPPEGVNFANGVLTGIPARAGTFTFDVRVTDQRTRTATQRFNLTVGAAPPLQIQGAPTPGISGQPYSAQFTVQGGTAPYRWSTTGTMPPGLTLDPATGALRGTPTTAGTYSFTVRVDDAGGLSGSLTQSLTVALPPVPPLQFTGLPSSASAQTQSDFSLALGTPFPEAITGVLRLNFQPDTGADDPSVLFANGARTLNFTIPAGIVQPTFAANRVSLQTGTVAGLITITTELSVNGTPLSSGQPPPQTIRIAPAAPVISSFDLTRTSAGFDLNIVGFATPRQVAQLVVRLTPAAGATIQTTDFTINVAAAFTAWYASTASVPFGGQFRLVLPFTLSDSTALASVSVSLSNTVGSSPSVSRNY